MAKNYLFIGLVLCSIHFSCLADSVNTRATLKSIYTSQIGVREASGKNDGVRVSLYLASVGLSAGNSWCAAFLYWCYMKTGVKVPKSGWSPSWFPSGNIIWKQGKLLRQKVPGCGDVFGIYFQSKRRVAHVGFVDEWGSSSVLTVEGNTNEAGSREGDGVYKKRRWTRQIHVVSQWIND